ncbi:DnaJ domain-containing protein [Dioscorea alata]|uniref:DnaJ domain-containing protein n=1 Tax=Dioscorea alata TaxID=55571 RepID=A0ACB7VJQ2_DIOAL|nr:DnaJ domain-containing protein [Dioscorea alata]
MSVMSLTLAGNLSLKTSSVGIRRRGAVAMAAAVAPAMRKEKKGLYEVLKVRETATAGEIKVAYRALAKRFHPDLGNGKDGNEMDFVEINRAYETLSDPLERAKYDSETRKGGFGFGYGVERRFQSRRTWETDQCW